MSAHRGPIPRSDKTGFDGCVLHFFFLQIPAPMVQTAAPKVQFFLVYVLISIYVEIMQILATLIHAEQVLPCGVLGHPERESVEKLMCRAGRHARRYGRIGVNSRPARQISTSRSLCGRQSLRKRSTASRMQSRISSKRSSNRLTGPPTPSTRIRPALRLASGMAMTPASLVMMCLENM